MKIWGRFLHWRLPFLHCRHIQENKHFTSWSERSPRWLLQHFWYLPDSLAVGNPKLLFGVDPPLGQVHYLGHPRRPKIHAVTGLRDEFCWEIWKLGASKETWLVLRNNDWKFQFPLYPMCWWNRGGWHQLRSWKNQAEAIVNWKLTTRCLEWCEKQQSCDIPIAFL